MLLAIDVGNSAIKAALFENGRETAFWFRPTYSDEPLETWLDARLEESNTLPDACLVASVVPSIELSFLAGKIPTVVHLHAGLNFGIPIRYENPLTLGADRLANALGGLALAKPPFIVVDAGTATKLEAVGLQGDYLGGAIMPGLVTGADALAGKAAKLPHLTPEAPPKAIGTTTAGAIQSGLVFGHASAIEGLIERFESEMGAASTVFLTGGYAPMVLSALKRPVRHVQHLTLLGLHEAAQRLGLAAAQQNLP